MGLFDFLGSAGPLFMASQKRETPFNIDYGKLINPGAQAPAIGGGKTDYKWNDPDSREREYSEMQARDIMGGLVKKYGSDINSITRDPEFNTARNLMSVDWQQARIRDNRKETDDKFKADLTKEGDERLESGYYKGFTQTGQLTTAGDVFNRALQTPTSQLPNYDQVYAQVAGVGTSKDFDTKIKDAFSLATGKNVTDVTEIMKSPDGRKDLLKSVGEHYGLTNETIDKMDNATQMDYLTRYVGEQLTGKSADYLKQQYVANTQLPPDYYELAAPVKQKYLDVYKQYINPNADPSKVEKMAADYYSSKFNSFVQQRIDDAVGMTRESSIKREEKYQNVGNYLEDAQRRLKIGMMQKEITGPYKEAFQGVAQPTAQIAAPSIQVKDKDGNYSEFTPKGNIGVWSGFSYNFDPGKVKFDASTIGSKVIISGKENDPKTALKGGIVDHVGDVSQTVATSRDEYLKLARAGYIRLSPEQVNMIEIGKGENLTKEELQNLQSTGSLAMNKVVDERIFMPREQYQPGKISVLTRDSDNKITDDDAYHTEALRIGGKELNEYAIDKDAFQYVDKDSPAGKKYGTEGYYVNGQTVITPLDYDKLDRLTHQNQTITQRESIPSEYAVTEEEQ